MNKRKVLIAAAGLVAVSLTAAGVLAASLAEFEIRWHVVAGGGGHSASPGYALDGSIGQPDAGLLSGGDYTLGGGFWGSGAAVASPSPTATSTATATPTPTTTATATPTPTATVEPPTCLIYLPVLLRGS